MSIIKEFKEFAVKGNVVDMAVGVIIGAAFGKIVASLVSDIIMPPIGLVVGNVDFSDLSLVLRQATATAKPVTLNYGLFLNNVINFLIVAFSIFICIKGINRLKRKEPANAPAPTEKNCPQCLMTVPIAARKCGHCTSTIAVLLFFALLGAQVVRADEAPVAPTKRWKNVTEGSAVSTNGNSKSNTYFAKNTFNYDWTHFGLEVVGSALGSDSRGEKTAEQYLANEKGMYKFTDRNYMFERFQWDKDRFAGIENRYDSSVGLGRDVVKNHSDLLSIELGGGYINEDRRPGGTNDFPSGRAYSKYTHTFTPTATFSQDVEYLHNFKNPDDFRVNTETALISALSTHFSLKVGYKWKHVGEPPAGFHRNDTTTSVSLLATY